MGCGASEWNGVNVTVVTDVFASVYISLYGQYLISSICAILFGLAMFRFSVSNDAMTHASRALGA